MRLKSLTMKGFKSFANETVINFNEDVIGIVGPNGSGKSNVVDAMRWVLGEQKSKELRLEKMSSVIFNGTKKRKQSGMAQVSLTFENTKNLLPTEYHTVTVSRILYQTGESEYRLNNVTCRLKDITSLFLDTGIGSNSYAIIALGMVDDILNDKENSRRRMFEQAAGISKYKKRKRETLNKLNNTTEDLDRIEDLLFEIENNLKQLEKQAKRAKKYYELKDNYKEFSIELSIRKLQGFKGKHETVTKQLQEAEDKFRNLEVSSRQMEAKLETDRKENLDKEKMLSEAQRAVNELLGMVRDQESEKSILLQKKGFVEQNKIKLSTQIENSRNRIAELTDSLESYRQQIHEDKALEESLEAELDTVEKNLNEIRASHGSLKEELETFLVQQQELEREIFEFEKRKAINANQIENLTKEIDESAGEIASRSVEIEALEKELSTTEAAQKEKQDLVHKIESEEAQRRTDIQTTEQEIEAARKAISDVNRELDARRNEQKLTKSMVENLEGFPESIKFLSKNKDWNNEAPLLSDVLYVKEGYRVAIENYLEKYLNYYVVKNLQEAYQAISLLSNTQKGKANFFLLDAFKDYQEPISMLPNTEKAVAFIETDAPYQKLIDYLLQNVVVTESEDVLKNIPNSEWTVLSKSGRFVQRKFSISGGSVGLFEGKKIGRKKNLEVLEGVIKKLEKEEREKSTIFYNLKAKLDQLKEGIQSEAINREREALNQIAQQKVSVMTRLENFETFVTNATRKQEASQELIRALTNSNGKIDEQLIEKRTQADNAKQEISEKDGSFREIAESLSVASNAFNEKNIAFIRQQNKVTTIQQELNFREKQMGENEALLNQAQTGLSQGETELNGITEGVAALEVKLLASYEARKLKEEALTAVEQNYFQARGGINEQEDELRTLNRKRNQAQMNIQQFRDNFNELKLELSSVGERLKIEFNISVDEVINQEPNSKYDEEELNTKVLKIKKRLDNYGEINPMAMEAFDEMKIRYDNITTQRNDILDAKKSLLETIKEIEDTATEYFLGAFNQVRKYFIEVFRTLFSEDDTCNLLLEDPDNPLESKIVITAKPKGKRPQSINQLSGGEKTLTATALLFALYLLKPAPFCIFDEVDAPLDDANIEKFNKIIRKFSTESQFIIVTHNKQTMAAVDVIYGVYMQEQGVSGVSPVDFRELDHAATLETV